MIINMKREFGEFGEFGVFIYTTLLKVSYTLW